MLPYFLGFLATPKIPERVFIQKTKSVNGAGIYSRILVPSLHLMHSLKKCKIHYNTIRSLEVMMGFCILFWGLGSKFTPKGNSAASSTRVYKNLLYGD